MSLCIAWVRSFNNVDEIIIATDSCYSGGQRFFAAPKIFPLKRNDCAIACAGDTSYSFPIAEHISRAIDLNPMLSNRAIDFTDFRHYVLDLANKCLFEEQDPSTSPKGPEFQMILAGHSWKTREAYIYEIFYDKCIKKMNYRTQSTIKKTKFAVIGDCTPTVRKAIFDKLNSEGLPDGGRIDMQPLEVLYQFISDKTPQTYPIGGYPQMVKIYPYPNVLPIAIKLKNATNHDIITYFGRPCLKYEMIPFPIYDVEQKKMLYMKKVDDGFSLEPEILGPLPFES